RRLATHCMPFIGLTEMEKSNISPKSNKLFTLSSIKQATRALLGKGAKDGFTKEEKALAESFWKIVAENMPDWQMVISKQVSPAQLRQEYIHAHGVGLHAIGVMGNSLLCEEPEKWAEKLKKLRNINWLKT
ncbi:DNA sulfur modification protein DndB, partial [Vibrio cholerae]